MSRSLNGVLDVMTTVVTQDGLNDIIAKVIQKEVSIKHDAMQDSLNTTVGHKLMLAQLAFASIKLSQSNSTPVEVHFHGLKHTIRYLYTTWRHTLFISTS